MPMTEYPRAAKRSIHPFPARMAPEIALKAIPERGREPMTVLDPMCGSGTVLAVAVERGHNAIGVDIDPLAVMMSRLSVKQIKKDSLVAAGKQILAKARTSEGQSPWGGDDETERFVDYWFAAGQKRQLIALSSAVNDLDDDDLRSALQLAISRTIITKSPQASLAADTAHSRPHRVQKSSDYDVMSGFERSIGRLERVLSERNVQGSAQVRLGDARHLTHICDSAVDMAVTSPPYLNALDYLRGHKLALVWFGYTVADIRVRRGESIGSERALGTETSAAVKAIVDIIRDEASDPSSLKAPMIERFAQDCTEFAGELRRVVKPAGEVVLVVGNSTLRGNYIRNDWITQVAMEAAGFSLADRYEREIPPSKRYMAISATEGSSVTKRMRREVVLTMM